MKFENKGKNKQVNIDLIKKTSTANANKLYGSSTNQPTNKKIPLYLTDELHEKAIRFTTEEKITGGELTSVSALVRSLLTDFFNKNI